MSAEPEQKPGGESLDVQVTVVNKRLSSTRRDRGYLSVELRASADGKPTFAMDWTIIVLTREGVNDDAG